MQLRPLSELTEPVRRPALPQDTYLIIANFRIDRYKAFWNFAMP
jgi:hypothetical protein